MHGRAQGQHYIGDVLGDAGVLGRFHIGGDGGDGGAGAQGHHGRPEDMAEHLAGAALAAAEEGEEREGREDVDGAEGIVDQQRPAIVGGDLGAVGGHQVGKEAEEGDGSVVGDDLDELHHHVGQIVQPLADRGILAAVEVDGEAEEQGEDDQRQHGLAAQQADKVLSGKEVDDHLRDGGILAQLLGRDILPRDQDRGNQPHQHEHDAGGDGAGDDEGTNGDAHDFAGPFAAAHIGHSAGDGREDHGNHDTEHHVDKHGAQRFQNLGAGALFCGREQEAHHTASDDGYQHADQQAVVAEPAVLLALLRHRIFLLNVPPGRRQLDGPIIHKKPTKVNEIFTRLSTNPDARSSS